MTKNFAIYNFDQFLRLHFSLNEGAEIQTLDRLSNAFTAVFDLT